MPPRLYPTLHTLHPCTPATTPNPTHSTHPSFSAFGPPSSAPLHSRCYIHPPLLSLLPLLMRDPLPLSLLPGPLRHYTDTCYRENTVDFSIHHVPGSRLEMHLDENGARQEYKGTKGPQDYTRTMMAAQKPPQSPLQPRRPETRMETRPLTPSPSHPSTLCATLASPHLRRQVPCQPVCRLAAGSALEQRAGAAVRRLRRQLAGTADQLGQHRHHLRRPGQFPHPRTHHPEQG
jgi:hypothetical protein